MFDRSMLADGGQLIGVLLILAAAVGYLTVYYRRVIKGDSRCGCDCGIPLKRSKKGAEKNSQAASAQQFLPAENLADVAARLSRQRADAEQAVKDPNPDTATHE